ncbi:MAG: S41 family peptidase [Gelidibacter sp.]
MKRLIFIIIVVLNFSSVQSQENEIDRTKIKEDLNEILSDLSQNYVYLEEKNVDLDCIRQYYENEIENINTDEETVLFFEYLLDEFYDSHLILNTNRNSSFRLYSPIYSKIENGKAIIHNVWQTQIQNLDQNLIGAEIQKINDLDFDKAIEQFPTHCNDKNSNIIREWISNKILAGRYNEPRVLKLKLTNNKTIEFDLDKIDIKKNNELLTTTTHNGIGIIRVNNSLGNNGLINEFDESLDQLKNTKGLIIDLRNTVDGGNSYVARGILSRFIKEDKPYQKHWTTEQYDGNPIVERSWIEYVSPRKSQYEKPVVILVGRWTRSMGEGLAIGFEGMERAKIVGSEMERLAGEMNGFSFINQKYGYRLSTAKLYHINGTPREKYVPTIYVTQTTTEKDETLAKGIELINKIAEK